MTKQTIRARDKDELARFLGWFSVGLGTAQLAAPKTMCRLVGARPDGAAPKLMRVIGLRELAQGIGILSRPRPTVWLWTRVAGDGVDLSLLGLTAARNRRRRVRAAVAIANVLAIAVADVLESAHLTRKRGEPVAKRRIRKAVTISASREAVEQAWAAAGDVRRKADAAGASVVVQDAPGGRGIELAVDFLEDPPLGDLGAAAAKLAGRDLATELADALRRLKQHVETGEVMRSDATPDGHLLARHLKQRPAQPLEEVGS
jgi:hypothetical protein